MAALRYGDDMGLEDRALFLTKKLVALDQVKEWKHVMKMEIAQNSEYQVDQVQNLTTMHAVLEKMGLLGLIKRTVIDLHCEATQSMVAASKKQTNFTVDDERLLLKTRTEDGCSLDVVRAARDNWEKLTSEEMLRLAKEIGRPLVEARTIVASIGTQGSKRDDEPVASEVDGTKPSKPNKGQAQGFLYDGTDLLRSLQAIEPSNRLREPTEAATDAWGSIQLQFYSPPFSEYRRLFSELAPEYGQIGLDEQFTVQRNVFLTEKNRVGDLVLAHQSVSMARQYSKTGCPISLRPQIWRQVLCIPITTQDRSYFEYLKTQATQWTYLTDDMYLLDLKQTIDSSDYFVFQDHLESVLMAFTRDMNVIRLAMQVNGAVHCSSTESGPLQTSAIQPDKTGGSTDNRLPPNGVLPFGGLVMYMAPLAYVYADPVEMYYVFRELYARYWSKLNAVRTERGTILPLCKLFEDLVVRSSPATVFHLINIGLKPLDIAFPWIQSAFSGVLDIDQVLLLWDRVVGYDSLELVAIFAAALFDFRATELELVNTREEADELFAELIDIPVVTLLQNYLFGLP